jgi:hypothetical protein
MNAANTKTQGALMVVVLSYGIVTAGILAKPEKIGNAIGGL